MKKYAREVRQTVTKALGFPPGTPLPEWMGFIDYNEFFDHTQLQTVNRLTEEAIFSDEDFILFTNEKEARTPFTVKMGSLLFTCCPGGKASFDLEIQFIDREARQTRTLFSFRGERYPNFQFTDLVPFSLHGKNAACMTIAMAPREERELAEAINLKRCAQQIRAMLIRMAINEPVHPSEFQENVANFFAAEEVFNVTVSQRVAPRAQVSQAAVDSRAPQFFENPHELQELDVLNFCDDRFKSRKPRNKKELAAKLAACFCMKLGILDNEIKQIVREYIDVTDQVLSEMDEAWVKTVMLVPIDLERYCLQVVIPQETSGSTLLKVILEIQEEEAANCEFFQGFNV